jgi:CheY-like chemotaxis protein
MADIMVVDDEPDIRELIRVNLSLDGHQVEMACNGEEALARLAEKKPALIVLDVMMPGSDGFSVLETLKRGDMAEVPVLMLTARADPMDRIRGGIEGAVVYLTKPFSVGELRKTVGEILAGGPEPRLRRRAQQTALEQLARVESGRGLLDDTVEPAAPRPRLTRLEPGGLSHGSRGRPEPSVFPAHLLSKRQLEVVQAIVSTECLSDAAESLGISRAYLYASLRRIASKVGAHSGPELARALRSGEMDAGDQLDQRL